MGCVVALDRNENENFDYTDVAKEPSNSYIVCSGLLYTSLPKSNVTTGQSRN